MTCLGGGHRVVIVNQSMHLDVRHCTSGELTIPSGIKHHILCNVLWRLRFINPSPRYTTQILEKYNCHCLTFSSNYPRSHCLHTTHLLQMEDNCSILLKVKRQIQCRFEIVKCIIVSTEMEVINSEDNWSILHEVNKQRHLV